MKSIYIAGGMTGIYRYNIFAFNAAEKELAVNYKVVNPIKLDAERGFDILGLPEGYDWNKFGDGLDLEETIRTDVDHVLKCDAIYMLRGWTYSTGAVAEHAIAKWAGKQIIYQATYHQPETFGLGGYYMDCWGSYRKIIRQEQDLRHYNEFNIETGWHNGSCNSNSDGWVSISRKQFVREIQ